VTVPLARICHGFTWLAMALLASVLATACSSEPVAREPARYGEAYRSGLRAQVIERGEEDGLRPGARELRRLEVDRSPAPAGSQDSLLAPPTSTATGGGMVGGR